MTPDEAKKFKAALEALVGTVHQWCSINVDNQGVPAIDSGALSSNAAVMRVLAENGLLSIKSEFGRRIFATWTEAARDFGVADWDFSKFLERRAKIQKGPPLNSKGTSPR
jgi:hypothetical protein